MQLAIVNFKRWAAANHESFKTFFSFSIFYRPKCIFLHSFRVFWMMRIEDSSQARSQEFLLGGATVLCGGALCTQPWAAPYPPLRSRVGLDYFFNADKLFMCLLFILISSSKNRFLTAWLWWEEINISRLGGEIKSDNHYSQSRLYLRVDCI